MYTRLQRHGERVQNLFRKSNYGSFSTCTTFVNSYINSENKLCYSDLTDL